MSGAPCRIRTGDASLATKRIASILTGRIWLRRLDSNQRMTRSKALCLTAWLRLNGGKDRNLTYDRRVAACRLFSWLLSREWLGWLDSNQRSSGSEPDALPLGHIPMIMTAPRLSLPLSSFERKSPVLVVYNRRFVFFWRKIQGSNLCASRPNCLANSPLHRLSNLPFEEALL